jgi:hypothetical protein
MLKETIEWRRNIKPDQIAFEEVKKVMEFGKLYHNGYDKFGRPIMYLIIIL